MMSTKINSRKIHSERVRSYYKFHAHIYDASRWAFLFGRNKILQMIPPLPSHTRIMEVGCGTGRNLRQLQYQLPDAQIMGIDLSSDMLKVAEKRVEKSERIQLVNANFLSNDLHTAPCDLILLSYSLTMFGDQPNDILECISKSLKPGGYLAVVDFNTSPLACFRRWMNVNHVDFSGNFLPFLKQKFHPLKTQLNSVYLGLWDYFLFVGQKQ